MKAPWGILNAAFIAQLWFMNAWLSQLLLIMLVLGMVEWFEVTVQSPLSATCPFLWCHNCVVKSLLEYSISWFLQYMHILAWNVTTVILGCDCSLVKFCCVGACLLTELQTIQHATGESQQFSCHTDPVSNKLSFTFNSMCSCKVCYSCCCAVIVLWYICVYVICTVLLDLDLSSKRLLFFSNGAVVIFLG